MAHQELPCKPREMQYHMLRSCGVSEWDEQSECECSAVLSTRQALVFVKSAGVFPAIQKVQTQASVGKYWQMQSIKELEIIPSVTCSTSFWMFFHVSWNMTLSGYFWSQVTSLIYLLILNFFVYLVIGKYHKDTKTPPTISLCLHLHCSSRLSCSPEEEAPWSLSTEESSQRLLSVHRFCV